MKPIPERYFQKLKEQKLTSADRSQFNDWIRSAPQKDVDEVLHIFGEYFESQDDIPHPDINKIRLKLNKVLDEKDTAVQSQYSKKILTMRWLAIAATFTAFIIAVTLYLNNGKINKDKSSTKIISAKSEIKPGGNRATLILANGSVIFLNASKKGLLAAQGSSQVLKPKEGKLTYRPNAAVKESTPQMWNRIVTPRGGQYQVQLPDGTDVWLNAESSLRFPTEFKGKTRQVELTGEAYFEVAKNRSHPFLVQINQSQVEVLGTHFNIMGYQDEPAMKTTLLEGSVRVTKNNVHQLIVPGEQAIVDQSIKVIKVNPNEAVEWKNGNFSFSHEKLESVMRKIARWYDVKINYEGKNTQAGFVGAIPRSQSISSVLKYLELTGAVHFKIEERRVIVMP